MKKLLSVIVLIALIAGCKSKSSIGKGSDSAQTGIGNEKDSAQLMSGISVTVSTWPESWLELYMAFSDNKVIRQARKNNFLEEWVYDSTLKTDSAVYDTYRIGHDEYTRNNSDTRFVVDQWLYMDTMSKQLYEYDAPSRRLEKWWTAEEISQLFYPIYELSSKTTAFVVPFEGTVQSDFLHELFRRIPTGLKLFDTSGYYKLMKNDAFEKAANKFFDKEYYVYGTEGYVKTRVKEVVVGLDKCMTNIFAFCLDNASIKPVGHPLFCSTKFMAITNAGNYSTLEKRFNKTLSGGNVYYSDSMKIKVLGQIGNCFLTYHDDFLWSLKNDKSTCKFPYRSVWAIDRNGAAALWTGGLDLYGLSCDN